MLIREVQLLDVEDITTIYNHYISNTVITFEEEEVTAEVFDQRIKKIKSLDLPWLVAEDDTKGVNDAGCDKHSGKDVLGYAYASPWRERSAYRFTVEVTVYLSPLAIHRGLGSKLYEALIAELRKKSVHVIIGVIALPNDASIALHEKFGMKKVAHFSEVGYKFDQWIDVGYWQLNL